MRDRGKARPFSLVRHGGDLIKLSFSKWCSEAWQVGLKPTIDTPLMSNKIVSVEPFRKIPTLKISGLHWNPLNLIHKERVKPVQGTSLHPSFASHQINRMV